jgi:hypothetical protein
MGPLDWAAWRERIRVRDARRGFSVDYKRVAIAYGVELAIIAVCITGNWLMASLYNHGDPVQLWLGVLAPIGYAVVEFARVPMALAIRTQSSRAVRVCCVIGIILSAGITAKSMSQLAAMMFHPRLIDVVHAQETLAQATSEAASLTARIAAADAVVRDSAEALANAQKTAQSINGQVASIPKDPCFPTTWVDRDGIRHQGVTCRPNPTRTAVLDALKAASGAIEKAKADYDAAVAARARLNSAALDQRVTEAKGAYREAVLHSQVHSLVAMAYGIAPGDVTDAQVHAFLRIFVFIPGFCVGAISTIIALTAIQKLKPATVALDTAGLGDLGAHVYAEAQRRVMADLSRIVEAVIRKRAKQEA